MGGYVAYPEYKDSNVEWIQRIPNKWQIKRLKFSVQLINQKVDAEISDLSYMGLEHIESWTGNRIEDETASSEGIATRFLPGDVLFGKLRPYLAKVHLARHEGLASTEALVLRRSSEIDSNFLRYYLVSKDFINIVDSSTFGSKIPRASWNFIGNLPVLLPDYKEQQTIARFLDYKTAQIDALIAKEELLLKKLAQKRTALISHAVTKGLDPSSPMKDSGVPWLGRIPETWSTKRLKFLLASPLKYGANETAELTDPEFPRYIRITDVNEDGTLRDETFRSLAPEIAKDYLLDDGDILLARSGATIGKSFIYRNTWGNSAYAGYLIRARVSNKLDPDFAYFFLQSDNYWQWLNSVFIQATIQNVSAEKYANLWISIPDIKEQNAIVCYLNTHTRNIDQQKVKAQQAINKLKEYRTSIITHAVTGKIDVRNVPVPEQDEAEAA